MGRGPPLKKGVFFKLALGALRGPLHESGNASEPWDACRDSGKRFLFLLIGLCSTGLEQCLEC